MGIYYVAGVPYSDDLRRYSITGQNSKVYNPEGLMKSSDYYEKTLMHYGTPRHSGRYPWGSGKNPYQSTGGKEFGNKVRSAAVKTGRAIGTAAKKTGSTVGKAASATAKYAGKRFKMNHPSLMSDQELREYTQRLIAEKNYSQMMSQYESPSGVGRATKIVKDLVRGTAGVPFAVVKGVGGVAGDMLKRGAFTLADAGFRKIAQEMTKSKLERENDELSNQVKNKELREKLQPKSKEGALSKAMSIINNPSSTASDVQEAKNILQNYSASKTFLNNILNNANNKTAAASTPKSSKSSTQVTKSGYAPAEWNRFKTWNMRSMDSLGDEYRRTYMPSSTSSKEPASYTLSYPDWWFKQIEERKRYGL